MQAMIIATVLDWTDCVHALAPEDEVSTNVCLSSHATFTVWHIHHYPDCQLRLLFTLHASR